MPKKIALFLYNMGGPDTDKDVPTFLRELFRDNDLLGIPGPTLLQITIAERIVAKRAPDVAAKYVEIGGGSPQLAITKALGARISALLNVSQQSDFEYVHIGPMMRYTEPRASTCLDVAVKAGADEIWLLSQYPHCARATTGSSLREFAQQRSEHTAARALPVRSFASYGDDHDFVTLWAKRLEQQWEQLHPQRRHLIVSAHNLPVSYIADGDPYRNQIYRSALATLRRLGLCEGRDWTLAWQSAVGPSKWMQPDTRDIIRNMAAAAKTEILIWPVAFVSDHIETLHEIDIEFAEIAHKAGIAKFIRVPNFNAEADFAEYLVRKISTAAQDLKANGDSLQLRKLDDFPSGEGCHWQPGGCLCGRYFVAGKAGLSRGLLDAQVPPSKPKPSP